MSSFTLARSLTLVGAALGWVALPPSIVEPAIALSIAYVAAENLFATEPRGRRALTFAFGLVHGFGFDGVLAERGLPARALVPSLLALNVGVELGQLAVVTLAMPVLWLLAASPWRAGGVALAVAPIAGAYTLLAVAGADRGALAAVLFGALPLLALTSQRGGYARGVTRLGSVALAALWFVERVSGWSFARGAFG